MGASIGAGIPNSRGSLKHVQTDYRSQGGDPFSGAFTAESYNALDVTYNTESGCWTYTFDMDLGSANSIYGASDTVQMPAVCAQYIVRC